MIPSKELPFERVEDDLDLILVFGFLQLLDHASENLEKVGASKIFKVVATALEVVKIVGHMRVLGATERTAEPRDHI